MRTNQVTDALFGPTLAGTVEWDANGQRLRSLRSKGVLPRDQFVFAGLIVSQ